MYVNVKPGYCEGQKQVNDFHILPGMSILRLSVEHIVTARKK
jgi:hypothetical protein